MVNFTSNTYQMKREILSFSNKISKNLPKPEKKFMADMNYGILASGSCLLTNSNHPVSIFSEIHSSEEKNFTSINTVTFSAMDRAAALFGKATFVMDRGYDDNKMFLKLDSLHQDYVIRLTAKRKLLYYNKWVFATELRNRRKGKVKLPLFYKGKKHNAYLSESVKLFL